MPSCRLCAKDISPPMTSFDGFFSWACKGKWAIPLTFPCKICNTSITAKRETNPEKYRVCSKECYDIKSNPNVGEAMLHFLFKKKTHRFAQELTDFELAAVGATSKGLRNPAVKAQLGPWYGDHVANHYDATRGSVPIAADKMMEIAIQSYQTAVRLKTASLPVILYRVSDRNHLTKDEEQSQTVAAY